MNSEIYLSAPFLLMRCIPVQDLRPLFYRPVPSELGSRIPVYCWIREKSERSTPMRQSRSSAENSSDISGPSFSETDSFSNRSGISRNTLSSRHSPRNVSSCKSSSRPSSRPSSRQSSQPSSRAPSDMSQDAVDDFKNKRKFAASQKLSGLPSSSKRANQSSEMSKIPSAKRPVMPSNQENKKK